MAYEAADPYAELSSPTIALDEYLNNKSYLMWSERGQLKKVIGNASAGTWNSTAATAGAGKHPAFEHAIPFLGNLATYNSATYTSPLYNINTSIINSSLAKTASEEDAEERKYSRIIYAIDTVENQSFSVKMTQPKLNGRHIYFVAINDTLPGINESNFFSYLKTESANIQSDDDTLDFEISMSAKNFKDSSLVIPFKINAGKITGINNEVLSLNQSVRRKYSPVAVKKAFKNMQNKEFNLEISSKLPSVISGKKLGIRNSACL
jgi:hypothetical protein